MPSQSTYFRRLLMISKAKWMFWLNVVMCFVLFFNVCFMLWILELWDCIHQLAIHTNILNTIIFSFKNSLEHQYQESWMLTIRKALVFFWICYLTAIAKRYVMGVVFQVGRSLLLFVDHLQDLFLFNISLHFKDIINNM
jgi:hypothetical protein